MFADAFFALLAMLFWLLTVNKYGMSDSINTTLFDLFRCCCFNDIKYHTSAVLKVKVNTIERCQNSCVCKGFRLPADDMRVETQLATCML